MRAAVFVPPSLRVVGNAHPGYVCPGFACRGVRIGVAGDDVDFVVWLGLTKAPLSCQVTAGTTR